MTDAVIEEIQRSEANADVVELQRLLRLAKKALAVAALDTARLNWLEANFIHATDNNLHAPLKLYWGRNVSLRKIIDRELFKPKGTRSHG